METLDNSWTVYYNDQCTTTDFFAGEIIEIPAHLINIPDVFIDVIKRFCPEIDNITPINAHEKYDSFRIYVDIEVNRTDNIKSKTEYGELFRVYLKTTYPDCEFIKFDVNSVVLPKNKTNREKFMEIFGNYHP
jgi:hypothetical protein